ncbi:hypothetical protein ACXHQL_17615 [Vibrio parahaemolyticus]|uniref:hypothetical protein n=1 Tax=Vibrio parahaemolyticus TaxID=670 RepID=UPI001D16D29A|nr:hypothetical protein [Vibrio parahaemolyticus]MCC3798339.1 hypothetical protein [Vibrio parahaemolyticus]MCC3813137.1 hypothetical protein [Vibrio parahaemolyticus]
MSIKQLRAAIAPCCGLGANREEVDAALNSVSAQLSTQAQSLTEAEILRMIKQPGQFQPMPKVAVSQIDQVIHDLFSNNWTSDLRTAPIDKMRAQLYKNLKDQLAGYWTGHTAYWILVNGGFIVDGPKGTAKQLTRFGSMFKEEMESINDTAQEARSHLQSQALQQTAAMVPVAQIEKSVEEHVDYLISLIRTVRVSDKWLPNGHWIRRVWRRPVQCWPWSSDASIKSIERRIQAAIKSREFVKAQHLDNVKQALVFIESNPIELGAMA